MAKGWFAVVVASATLTMGIGSAFGGAPHLVTDINAQIIPVSSYPAEFTDEGTWEYFSANDGKDSFEPWISNGTAAGTFMWGHVAAPGSGVTFLQPLRVGSRAFALYPDPLTGATTIWVTDGTQGGSRSLSPISASSSGINPGLLAPIGNRAALTFFNPATGQRDLWVTDGTDAGTGRVQSASGASFSVVGATTLNGKLYFESSVGSGPLEIWVSDGTSAGTQRLAQVPNGAVSGATLLAVGSYILFPATTPAAGSELWSLNVATNQVALLQDIAPGSASGFPPGAMWAFGSTALFTASSSGDGNLSLWRTDGTPAGTFLLAAAAPYSALGTDALLVGPASTNAIYKTAAGELWVTDGTPSGTQLLYSGVGLIAQVGGRFYFTPSAGPTFPLWTTDGTVAGTHVLPNLVATRQVPQLAGTSTTLYLRLPTGIGMTGQILRYDLSSATTTVLASYAGTTQPQYATGVFSYALGRLWFDNEDPVHGRELWTSDGTVAGTALFKNVAPDTQTQSSNPADFVSFNGKLYFTADDGVSGREVWYSDGTAAGTHQLADLNPGQAGSSPSDLFVANGALFFFAIDGTGTSYLWRSDGTTSGTQRLTAAMAIPNAYRTASCSSRGVVLAGVAYFATIETSGLQLWRSDGTPGGTLRVATSSGFNGLCSLTVVGNRLYFAGTGSGSGAGLELWSTDGTATALVSDINPGSPSSSPASLTPFSNRLYFIATDSRAPRLWSSDGTAGGTASTISFGSGTPMALAVTGSSWLAVSVAAPAAAELWTTDGTSGGTQQLSTNLSAPAIFGNRGFVYYAGVATSGNAMGTEPWVSDGTAAGTRQLVQLNPMTGSSPDTFLDFNGVTYFQASPTGIVRQVWRTNGTPSGTQSVADIVMYPPELAAGRNLFFVHDDGTTGSELWTLGNDPPLAANDAAGNVTAGSSIAISVLANDADPDGSVNPASVSIVANPAHGTVTVASNGTVTYTAASGYAGSDSFSYTVADDLGAVSAPATVSVTVVAPPTPPPSSGSGGGGGALDLRAVAGLAVVILLRSARRRRRDAR